jgi:hypothetical protein
MKFEKGQSGNPGGRPKEVEEVKALARQHGPAAIAKLAQLMECGSPRTEVAAAQALLDRGYGKPAQAITGEDGGPLKIEINIVRFSEA